MEEKKERKIDTVLNVPCTLDSIFSYWLEFLKPFHNLTNTELRVASAILKVRYKLSKVVISEDLLDELIFNDTYRKEVRTMCDIKLAHFNIILNKLKKCNFLLEGNRINPKFIPQIKEDNNVYQLLILFRYNNE